MGENPILSGLDYDPRAGALSYRGVRYLLIRPETVVEFQKAVERTLGAAACGEMVYRGGFAGGSLSSRKYRETFSSTDRGTAEFMCMMGGQIGWGRFVLARFDRDAGELAVRVSHSPFARAYGPSEVPVCHFIRGIIGGLACVVLGGDAAAVEESCQATGAVECRFVARTTGIRG